MFFLVSTEELGSKLFVGLNLNIEKFYWIILHAETMNILEIIVEHKKGELAKLPDQKVDSDLLKRALNQRGDVRDFEKALRNPRRGKVSLIAEVKKASPSAGVICSDFHPVEIAKQYETCGATCISVLTDVKFFEGNPEYLKAIRQNVSLPLLRKDFIIDQRQIYESIQLGADAILLIVSILEQEKLRFFHKLITQAGLSALVEVHNEDELNIALDVGATLIGINNRDLKTFKVDLNNSERLAEKIRTSPHGDSITIVAESGISTKTDVERLAKCGVNAILVGESLLRRGTIKERIEELLD